MNPPNQVSENGARALLLRRSCRPRRCLGRRKLLEARIAAEGIPRRIGAQLRRRRTARLLQQELDAGYAAVAIAGHRGYLDLRAFGPRPEDRVVRIELDGALRLLARIFVAAGAGIGEGEIDGN